MKENKFQLGKNISGVIQGNPRMSPFNFNVDLYKLFAFKLAEHLDIKTLDYSIVDIVVGNHKTFYVTYDFGSTNCISPIFIYDNLGEFLNSKLYNDYSDEIDKKCFINYLCGFDINPLNTEFKVIYKDNCFYLDSIYDYYPNEFVSDRENVNLYNKYLLFNFDKEFTTKIKTYINEITLDKLLPNYSTFDNKLSKNFDKVLSKIKNRFKPWVYS